MKKILFVAALCVAGLASANNGKVEIDNKVKVSESVGSTVNEE